MIKHTVAGLREAHNRLHKEEIPHNCQDIYRMEALLLYEELSKDPQLYPILLFTYHAGIWN
jgi:hypothetical protein